MHHLSIVHCRNHSISFLELFYEEDLQSNILDFRRFFVDVVTTDCVSTNFIGCVLFSVAELYTEGYRSLAP